MFLRGRGNGPKRRRKHAFRKPLLHIFQILDWADEFHQRTRKWPKHFHGKIGSTFGETWGSVDMALRTGLRGLPRGLSLARLLASWRGVRNHMALPPYTPEQILHWADLHHLRTGLWPNQHAGGIVDAPGETWLAVNQALHNGLRGLPGGSSLASLLAQYRGVRNIQALPPLTISNILAWADAHHVRAGRWPMKTSGPVIHAPGETWMAVDVALVAGVRGLPGGSSLARLLAKHRGVRNHLMLPKLTIQGILAWADAHFHRAGRWPTTLSGAVTNAPGEKWGNIHAALEVGHRGLPGGTSLARLLAQHRGVRNRKALPPLTISNILAWADAHHRRTGRWPMRSSGPILDAPGETWTAVQMALVAGMRGLPGGSSLACLLAQRRGVRNHRRLPKLMIKDMLAWADAHFRRTGRWPTASSGAVTDAPGEKWSAIDTALYLGRRGLPEGSSLARLFAERRGAPLRVHAPLHPKIQTTKAVSGHRPPKRLC